LGKYRVEAGLGMCFFKIHLNQFVSYYHQHDKYHLHKPKLYEAMNLPKLTRFQSLEKSIKLFSVKNQIAWLSSLETLKSRPHSKSK
jgi:hypothetical protein